MVSSPSWCCIFAQRSCHRWLLNWVYAALCVLCIISGSVSWAAWCGGVDASVANPLWYASVVLFAVGVAMNLLAFTPAMKFVLSADDEMRDLCIAIATGINVGFIFIMQLACLSLIAFEWNTWGNWAHMDTINNHSNMWAWLTAAFLLLWIPGFGIKTVEAQLAFFPWAIAMSNTTYALFYMPWAAQYALLLMTTASIIVCMCFCVYACWTRDWDVSVDNGICYAYFAFILCAWQIATIALAGTALVQCCSAVIDSRYVWQTYARNVFYMAQTLPTAIFVLVLVCKLLALLACCVVGVPRCLRRCCGVIHDDIEAAKSQAGVVPVEEENSSLLAKRIN